MSYHIDQTEGSACWIAQHHWKSQGKNPDTGKNISVTTINVSLVDNMQDGNNRIFIYEYIILNLNCFIIILKYLH